LQHSNNNYDDHDDDDDTSIIKVNGNSNASTGFKKVKKTNLLKKRQADEDILSLLEKTSNENGTGSIGLGTRE